MLVLEWISISVGFTTLLFLTNNPITKLYNVIIPKGNYGEKTIKAETDIFPNFLVPTNVYRNCIFRISLQIKEFKKYPLFYIIRKSEMKTFIQELNKDIKLDTGMIHVFEINIDSREKLNFKFNEDVTIQNIFVEEIYIA